MARQGSNGDPSTFCAMLITKDTNRGPITASAAALLAALVVLAVYWPATSNGFIFDDFYYLVNVTVYREPAQWREALLRSPTGDPVYIRPLAMLTFVLPMWAGYTTPYTHHLLNLLIHAGSVALVTLLAWRVFRSDFERASNAAVAAATIGLVYGLHPGLTESVLWISCRFDLLMAFFLFGALLLDRSRNGRNWKYAAGVAALFLAALLCKEPAIGFLAALPIAHLALDRTPPQSPRWSAVIQAAWSVHHRTYIALSIAFGVWLLLRLAFAEDTSGVSRIARRFDAMGSTWEHAVVVATSLARLTADAIWPFSDLAPSRSLPLPVDRMAFLAAAMIAVPVTTAALVGALRTGTWRVAGLLFVAFIAALLPVCNLLPSLAFPGEVWVATRYLTFPVLFACLAATAFLIAAQRSWLRPYPRIPWIVAAGWILASAAIVRETIPLWSEEGVFYRWALTRAAPQSGPWLNLNLGSHYVRTGELVRARETFVSALEAKVPKSGSLEALLWYSLGNVERRLGNVGEAVHAFGNALVLDPDNLLARVGIAQTEQDRGNPARAVEILEAGLRRAEASPGGYRHEDAARLGLGRAYLAVGHLDAAVTQLTLARDRTRAAHIRTEAEEALKKIRGSSSQPRDHGGGDSVTR